MGQQHTRAVVELVRRHSPKTVTVRERRSRRYGFNPTKILGVFSRKRYFSFYARLQECIIFKKAPRPTTLTQTT